MSLNSINIDNMHLQQVIIHFWRITGPSKLMRVYRAIPSLIMWTLWKRRNARRHGGDINFHNMVVHVQKLIRQLIVMWFP
ncbi:hypothetical protein KY289_003189 [Solanum tuberosum]|nr:hypothetical protein KY289_003189 [Solanum tuberosum]